MGVWVDGKFNMNQQCALAAKRANRVLRCTKHNIARQSRDVIVSLYTALMQPPTSSAVCSFGHLNRKRTLNY